MNSVVLILIAIAIFVVAYLTYGRWLAKQWGIDPKQKTPAHTMEDGVDYVPSKAPILLGHHFASIAGAGPINGPIQAAFFGWVPVFLWIVIGGIFFGAVQDFGALFVSIRHKGHSIGEVIEENIGHRCKVLFNIFAWLVLILVIAAFGDIVAKTFVGISTNDAGEIVKNAANGSVATASILFIPLAIFFGILVYRKNAPFLLSTIIGVVLLGVCIAVGLVFPIYLSMNYWLVFIAIYIVVASVTPVWILLQPRDYLNSFLLYFMIGAAVIGILVAHPVMQVPAFVGFNVGGSMMFPVLFITVACGAISGFHSLVGSGTTSKQLDNEKDALAIGYGGMLIECVLAVISLVCIGTLVADGNYKNAGEIMLAGNNISLATPAIIFAAAVAGFFEQIGLSGGAVTAAYTIITLSISAFALTSLDTATRLARFIFQELMANTDGSEVTGIKKVLSDKYVSTIITAACGMVLCIGGYSKVWPLFGACNQLVAVPAFLCMAVYLARKGKNNKMLFIPMIFMLCATMLSLALSVKGNVMKLFVSGEGTWAVEGLQTIIIVPIFVLAVILVVEGTKVLIQVEKEKKKA